MLQWDVDNFKLNEANMNSLFHHFGSYDNKERLKREVEERRYRNILEQI